MAAPAAQKEETWETPAREDEKENPDGELVVEIEIDLTSVGNFIEKKPQAAKDVFDRAQKEKMDKTTLGQLDGNDFDNFLHDFLKGWWAYNNPKESTALVKAQTKQAVADLKKAIFSLNSDVQDSRLLTRDQWERFTEKVKTGKVVSEETEPLKSFETFGGKVFDPSDSGILGERGQVVYSGGVDKGEETPIQKYRRLKNEIQAFEAGLTKLAVQAKGGHDPTSQIVELLSQDLANMRAALSNNSAILFQGGSVKTVQEQLADLQKGISATEPTADIAGGQRSDSHLTALQNRVATLEKIVGSSKRGDALGTIAALSSKLDILGDPAKFKEIQRKVTGLTESLNTLRKEKKKFEPILQKQKSEKVEKLFQMMSTWDKAAVQLPVVVERLKSLQLLNSEAAGVVDLVNTLDDQQKQLTQALSEDKVLLETVNKTLASNCETIAANIASLDERIKKLTG